MKYPFLGQIKHFFLHFELFYPINIIIITIIILNLALTKELCRDTGLALLCNALQPPEMGS